MAKEEIIRLNALNYETISKRVQSYSFCSNNIEVQYYIFTRYIIMLIDIVGKRYGRLLVRKRACNIKIDIAWLCICDCGNTTIVRGGSLKSGATKSCGCLSKEKHTTHGMYGTREYNTWNTMKDRCYNVNNKHYSDYGGRGIKVCTRWKNSFEKFYKDMGKKPEGLSIDRRDNDGNYSKKNCRYINSTEQARNKRNSKRWFIRGIEYASLREAAKGEMVSTSTIYKLCNDKKLSNISVPNNRRCYSKYAY